jgi:lysozyme family protein
VTHHDIGAFIVDEFEAGDPPGTVTNDRADAGGITRWGITRPYLATSRRVKSVTADDIRNLTREQAIDALVEVSIMQSGLWQIPDWQLRLVVVDFEFNAGADDAVPALQRAVGVAADGVFGVATLAAATRVNLLHAVASVLVERQRFHIRKSANGVRCKTCGLPSQKKWIGGWLHRTTRLVEVCAA